MEFMLAIEISSFGGPEVLRAVQRPKPAPGPGEVLIRVEAAGVSRADAMQRQGRYPPPPGASDIPGLDLAGIVERAGAEVHCWNPGDRVCALVTGGAYAEYCAVPVQQILPIPDHWTSVEAATLPENFFTVYDNLITRAALEPGEWLLVHGGTSGIGTTAIMLGSAWGAQVIATAGTRPKCDACLQLGALYAINYKEVDFAEEIGGLTSGLGVDVILDLVGGPYLERDMNALAQDGRIIFVATQGGRSAMLDIAALMRKRAKIVGSTLRNRTPSQKGAITERLLRQVWPLLPRKYPIRPVIDSTFALRDAKLAHERLESGLNIGKIVLVCSA
jgi:NADPH2:quinone reductase